jgi:hypothetical protein
LKSKTYGGEIDLKNMATGAFPVVTESDELRESLRQAVIWSNWRTSKSLYARMLAKYGDCVLKVVDDPARGKAYIEILHPGKVYDAEFDGSGNVVRVIIEYEVEEKDDRTFTPRHHTAQRSKTYKYTEIIDKGEFQFFKDDKPWDYVNNVEGGEFARYANDYGFVPLVIPQYRNMGMNWGMNCFWTAIPKIDEINDQVSLLNDQIRKMVDPPWLFMGMAKPRTGSDVEASHSERDEMTALYSRNRDVDAKALIADLDVAAVSAHHQSLIAEVYEDLPVLLLNRKQDITNPTAPGMRALLNGAIDQVTEGMGNADDGAIRAFQMLCSMAGIRDYPGFEWIQKDSYDKGDLDFSLKLRPVFEDELTKQERITFLMGSNAPNSAVWAELGISDDVIKQWEADAEAEKEAQEEMMAAQAESLAGRGGNNGQNAPVDDNG